MTRQKANYLGQVIDRFVTVQYYVSGGAGTTFDEPVNPKLHKAALNEADSTSLTADAAMALNDAVNQNDVVLISTGFTVPPWNRAEADGPMSAATLARAIDFALEATPIIVTEGEHVNSIKQILSTSELQVAEPEEAVSGYRKVAVTSMPVSKQREAERSEELLDKYDPAAIVTIEKPSRTHDGTYRNGVEYDVSDVTAGVDTLIEMARNQNVITIGIGDGGNEVGMGRIHDTVAEIFSEEFAAVTKTDHLVVASTANWGAYGVEALLAVLAENPNVMHTREMEEEVQKATKHAGIVDPLTGFADGWLDATPPNVSQNVVDQLRTTVELHVNDQWHMDHWDEWSTRKKEVNRLLDNQAGRME